MGINRIRSRDGTEIAYEEQGAGPALLLVHGGFVDRAFWGPSLPLLAQHFMVYAMDRRGHGNSGPYPADHDLEREYEDVQELIAKIDAPITLLGHSSGALVALHAAWRSSLVQHLVLYEPPRFESLGPELREELRRQAASGDLDGIVAAVLMNVAEATSSVTFSAGQRHEMLDGMRWSPLWAAALRNASSIPAEVDSYAAYRFDPEAFRNFSVPTVLLLGSTSGPAMGGWVENLSAALHGSRIVVIKGQGHGAMNADPERFVRTVRDVLDPTRAKGDLQLLSRDSGPGTNQAK